MSAQTERAWRRKLRRHVVDNIRASRAARAACALGGDDTLSRTASAICRIRQGHAEAADCDAAFDGGEWSIPAHARAEEREVLAAAVAAYGSEEQYHAALACRLSARAAYRF